MKIKFVKTHPDATLPTIAKHGDVGMDLSAVEGTLIKARGNTVVPVGLTLAYLTPGYWFRIEARSGLGFKHSIFPHFGIVDSGYRGDLGVKLYNNSDEDYFVTKGDRIAQIVVYKSHRVKTSFTDIIDETERGASGFGSSGK